MQCCPLSRSGGEVCAVFECLGLHAGAGPVFCLTGTVLITALLLIAQLGQVIAQQVQDHSSSQPILPHVYFWVTPGTY